MGARGRKTKGDLEAPQRPSGGSLEELAAQVHARGLPAPPSYFGEDKQLLWLEIVTMAPPELFPRSTWPMLEVYVSASCEARYLRRQLQALIENGDPPSLRDHNTYLQMIDREDKKTLSAGVRLGIARTSMGGRHNSDPDQFDEGATGAAAGDDPFA